MTAKEEFISIYTENIKRKGADKLLEFLKKSDFFKAPSSTRFHGAYEGGLVQHSVNVYHCLKDYLSRPRTKEMYNMDFSEETIAIVALLHDVCKIDFYATEMRNRKNDETGQWEKVPFYTIKDNVPYGHGEKSVYIISGYLYGEGRLTRDEAMAIRWHMGFSGIEDKNTIGKALEMYPLALALNVADMEASYYLEGSEK
ncbi:MAG: HD domain-containing protein [Ruminococcus sp.]|nr:HD domain-containing protein [Ruminococcus sp.]MBR6385867.1 HD domain-containing protein [Ruminococcus sp.]